MDIAAHIGKLVLEHECVIIPKLGGFLTNYNTAEIKPQQHHILPPSRTLVFNSQLNTNDGLLANYLANQLDISYKTSLLLLEVFVNYCQRDLAEGKQIAFGNLGMLDMNTNNKLEFHPNTSINYNEDAFGLKAIPLKSIERKPDFSLQAPLMKKLVKPPKTKVIKLNGLALRKIAAVIIPLGILISAVFYFPSAHNNLQQTSLFSFLDSSKSALPSADKDVNLGELKVQQAEDNSSQEITEIDNSIPSEMEMSLSLKNLKLNFLKDNFISFVDLLLKRREQKFWWIV